MSVLLLVLSLVAVVFSWNAVLTTRHRYGPFWFPALLTGELAPFHVALQAGTAAGFWLAGWAGGWSGRIGLALFAVSVLLLFVNHLRGWPTRGVIEGAVADAVGAPIDEPVRLPPLRWWRLLRPYPAPPRGVVVERGRSYGPGPIHRFDRFTPAAAREPLPVLLQVHGGGWTGGRRDQQARPLMHRMALSGWAVYSISYRLSPKATFPDHLVDVKRAIAWIREHAAEEGLDTSFLAVTGGSAGAQLAALAALTPGRPEYQSGFEDADTAVQACIPLYGVHDLLDRTGKRPKWPYLSRYVLKAEPADEPERWEAASPIRSAAPGHPPFLIIHGSADTLVRPGESQRLAAALRAQGGGPVGGPVGLAEVPGATHGFDAIHSLRAERSVDGMQAFLEACLTRHRNRTRRARG